MAAKADVRTRSEHLSAAQHSSAREGREGGGVSAREGETVRREEQKAKKDREGASAAEQPGELVNQHCLGCCPLRILTVLNRYSSTPDDKPC